jgi:pyruvate/2-oxoglutarate dehydrogenase complex dihydrolipoamide acyltransferase (E2) component
MRVGVHTCRKAGPRASRNASGLTRRPGLGLQADGGTAPASTSSALGRGQRGSRRSRWPDARTALPVTALSSRMPATLPPFKSTSLGHLSAMPSPGSVPAAMKASRNATAATKDRAPRRGAPAGAASRASRRSCPRASPRPGPGGRAPAVCRAPASIPVPARRRLGARAASAMVLSVGSGPCGPRPRAIRSAHLQRSSISAAAAAGASIPKRFTTPSTMIAAEAISPA